MKIRMNPLEELIAAAHCELEVDLLLEGGKLPMSFQVKCIRRMLPFTKAE